MHNKRNKYLWDILYSIEQIESHIDGIGDLESFEVNILVRDAVERRLAILGEAVYRLLKMGVELTKADQIINRRNTLIHQYDDFNARSIWRHIQEDLAGIKAEVQQLIGPSRSNKHSLKPNIYP